MKIYFDNNATTPVDQAVKVAMLPYLEDRFGNPSSGHRFGEAARNGVEAAREQVAGLLHCHPKRLIFTSGGSESNNLAIYSAVSAYPDKKHIIASQVEHASVLLPLQYLANKGYEIELLPVSRHGGLDLDVLAAAIRPDTVLVSLMGANNETGVVWPVEAIGGICKEKRVLFHCDAVQLIGKMVLDLSDLPVDYLSVAGHKLHGPKGVGALYGKRTAPITPLILGAGQENGLRAGTENVQGIVGLGKACELAGQAVVEYGQKISQLRDHIERTIYDTIQDAMINGQDQARLANTLNISFRNCSSAAMIQELDEKGIAVSAHSACQSGDLDPSHVLLAMKIPEEYLHGTLRISLSRMSTMDEVESFISILPKLVKKSRLGLAV